MFKTIRLIQNLNIIILVTVFIYSCNSQHTIDLANISMPYTGIDQLPINSNKDKRATAFNNILAYKSYDANLLNFNNLNLSGELTDSKTDFLNKNHLEFYVDTKKKEIPFLRIYIYTAEQSNALYMYILKKGISFFFVST